MLQTCPACGADMGQARGRLWEDGHWYHPACVPEPTPIAGEERAALLAKYPTPNVFEGRAFTAEEFGEAQRARRVLEAAHPRPAASAVPVTDNGSFEGNRALSVTGRKAKAFHARRAWLVSAVISAAEYDERCTKNATEQYFWRDAERHLAELEAVRAWEVIPPEQPYGSLDALCVAEVGVPLAVVRGGLAEAEALDARDRREQDESVQGFRSDLVSIIHEVKRSSRPAGTTAQRAAS